jgi:hypothetical protein
MSREPVSSVPLSAVMVRTGRRRARISLMVRRAKAAAVRAGSWPMTKSDTFG